MRTILTASIVAFIILAPFLSLPVQHAEAAVKFWTGNGNGVSWSDPNNWSGNTLPASTDTIIIDGTPAFPFTVHLDIDFQLDPTGSITIGADRDTLIIEFGVTLANDGAINNNYLIDIVGTLENSGIISNDAFLQLSGGTIENSGIINNNLIITNLGTINNGGVGGTINNNGNIDNTQFGTINNGRYFNNDGSIDNEGIINNDGTIANDGVINNEPNGAINNNSGGTINNNVVVQNFGNMTNSGIINNFDRIDNHGNITNDGTINNYDTINNFPTGTIHNNGTINNKCGATFNNFGTYTGNPVNNESCVPSAGLLEISKAITLNQNGVDVEETLSNFKNIQIVEATLVDPLKNIYVYLDIPKNVPGFIQFNDPEWDPDVQLFDGKWELKLQIIAMYIDPATNELKPIEQKIIIQFDVVEGVIAVDPDGLDIEKNIVIDPHPAQLGGNVDITIGEDLSPGETKVFVAEVTLVKPSGEIIWYTAFPVEITEGPATIPFPGPGWVASDGIVEFDQMGIWELDIEIIAFYEDGIMEIKKINQKLWISFNVIPESAIGTIALVGSSLAALGFKFWKRKQGNSQPRSLGDLGI